MDDMDVAICRMLLMNARTPYSEIGRALEMTPQAIHRRVQTLIEDGIITGSGAFLTHRALGQMWVMVHGWSEAPSMADLADRLAVGKFVAVMFVASGNQVYVHGSVTDFDELTGFVNMVQQEAMISDIQVGILAKPPPAEPGLVSRLDLRIISSLQEDARRPVTEVSEETGASVKTVRRRLKRLIDEGLVHLAIHWEPETQGAVISNIHLSLMDDVEPERAAFVLIKRLGKKAVRTLSFVDRSDLVIASVWSPNVRDMQSICDDLEAEGIFKSVVPHILRSIYYFDENRHAPLTERLERANGQRIRKFKSRV